MSARYATTLVRIEIVHDAADTKPEEAVDLAHPLRVALGKVVVDGDDVHALALQCIEVRRKRRNERFALACLHLGDTSLMQDHAAQKLHIEVPHADGSDARLAHDRKRLDEKIVQRFAVLQPFFELDRLVAELLVRQCFHLRLQLVDRLHLRIQLLEFALARRAEDPIQKSHKNLLIRN